MCKSKFQPNFSNLISGTLPLSTQENHTICSVFPTEGFLRPGTQVRRFGRKLKALDAFFCKNLMPNFKKLGFRPHKIENFSRERAPGPPGVFLDASKNGSRKITGFVVARQGCQKIRAIPSVDVETCSFSQPLLWFPSLFEGLNFVHIRK